MCVSCVWSPPQWCQFPEAAAESRPRERLHAVAGRADRAQAAPALAAARRAHLCRRGPGLGGYL